jgi:tetratricopeptide (TPR) repeat protein
MLKIRHLITLLVICGAGSQTLAQSAAESNAAAPAAPSRDISEVKFSLPAGRKEKLFSPSVSQVFYLTARELAAGENATRADAEQALVLLNAAMALDNSAKYMLTDIIRTASRPADENRSRMVYDLLMKYVDKSADLEVADSAVRYLLEQLSNREQREMLMAILFRNVGQTNPALGSELATLQGLLLAEKTDDVNAAMAFSFAYNKDKFNQLAFDKFSELAPSPPAPAVYLEYLRYRIRENPFDADVAMMFADYSLKTGLYDIAAGAYEYCAELYKFLRSTDVLPASIYLPWSLANYNTARGRHTCVQIAEQLRKQGRFDLLAEMLAAKATAAAGDAEQASRILKAAEEKSLQLLAAGDKSVNYEQLAFFYCFALPDAAKAIDSANKAYATQPGSPTAAGLLAFALVSYGQPEIAKPLLDSNDLTQPAALASALVKLADGQKDSAIEILKSAIDKDPGSLVAEHAKQILARQGSDYIPLYDADLVTATLKASIGEMLIPQFARPDQIISVQLSVKGNRFSYDSDFGAVFAVTNNWSEPLPVTGDGLLQGNIRIDAEISGDLNAKIPNLVVLRTRPSLPIEPKNSLLVPVQLYTGRLRQILLAHPQASLNVQLTAFLDPVTTPDGNTANRIPGVEPARLALERPRVEINRDFLQNRLNSLSWGRQGQKIKSCRLFVGLLAEQQALAESKPAYKSALTGEMSALLKSAIALALTDDDWVVRVHAMQSVTDLPLDYEMMTAVAAGLSDTNWPARLMALYTLAKNQGDTFRKVLDHTAEYDSDEFVRNMAVALGGAPPIPKQLPAEPNQPIQQTVTKPADSNNL